MPDDAARLSGALPRPLPAVACSIHSALSAMTSSRIRLTRWRLPRPRRICVKSSVPHNPCRIALSLKSSSAAAQQTPIKVCFPLIKLTRSNSFGCSRAASAAAVQIFVIVFENDVDLRISASFGSFGVAADFLEKTLRHADRKFVKFLFFFYFFHIGSIDCPPFVRSLCGQ